MRVVSAMSLFQKKMLNHWQQFVTQEIINTNNDDRTYLHLIWLNGYLNKSCSKWTVHELLKSYGISLDEPMGKSGIIKTGRIYDKVSQREFCKISNKSVFNSFGFWK